MTTARREGSPQPTHEGLDPLAGTHVRARTKRDRPREDALAEAADRLPAGAEPDLGTPMSDRQLDERDRQQSAKRKRPGPTPPETRPDTPVAPPTSPTPPTDPE